MSRGPVTFVGVSDTQAGRGRNTKMAAACSICLHAGISDVSTAVVKDILNKMGFFVFVGVFFSFSSSVSSLPLHCPFISFLVCPSSSLFSSSSIFNKDLSDLVKQKLPPVQSDLLIVCEPRWVDLTEVREAVEVKKSG